VGRSAPIKCVTLRVTQTKGAPLSSFPFACGAPEVAPLKKRTEDAGVFALGLKPGYTGKNISEEDLPLKPHRSLFFSFLLFVLLLPLWSFAGREPATIIRAVDGDTLEVSLDGHSEKVRLIGVDTPEVHESEKLHRDSARTHQDEATIKALGQRAWDFTKSVVHAGDQVRLEYGQEPRDKYYRILAFVWLPDGRMLNETIICEGFGNAYMRYPFNPEYMERFRAKGKD